LWIRSVSHLRGKCVWNCWYFINFFLLVKLIKTSDIHNEDENVNNAHNHMKSCSYFLKCDQVLFNNWRNFRYSKSSKINFLRWFLSFINIFRFDIFLLITLFLFHIFSFTTLFHCLFSFFSFFLLLFFSLLKLFIKVFN